MFLASFAPAAATSAAPAPDPQEVMILASRTSSAHEAVDDRAELAVIREQQRADRSAREAQAAAETRAAAQRAAEAQARADAEARARTAAAEAQARASRSAPRAAPASGGSVQAVIGFARAQIGKPYVYGAAGPGSYDCSGLTMRAYERIGIRLGHYTGSQLAAGRAVSRSQLQPGDLVFPSSEHVGIYIGNNQIVHAPQPGDSVKVSNLWAFYAARRLV